MHGEREEPARLCDPYELYSTGAILWPIWFVGTLVGLPTVEEKVHSQELDCYL